MAKHISYKGQTIDMELLKFQNQDRVALGNANMNARGDIIGRGGVVLKTNEELMAESENFVNKEVADVPMDSLSESIEPQMEDFNFDAFEEPTPIKETPKRAPTRRKE